MTVSVCHSCGTKTDSIHNYSVDGYIEEGITLYNCGNLDSAKASFRNALSILKAKRGCSCCKDAIEKAIDMC